MGASFPQTHHQTPDKGGSPSYTPLTHSGPAHPTPLSTWSTLLSFPILPSAAAGEGLGQVPYLLPPHGIQERHDLLSHSYIFRPSWPTSL